MIVLLSDFGDSEYAGMMKGVIYTIHPPAQIVDLTHQITPQSVNEGAWVLLQSYKHFPPKAVFVCVIDPGVGTERDPVLVESKRYVFIGPDNGLLYPAAFDDGIKQVFTIQVEGPVSATFHGRDIFARMAAHVARGTRERYLGPTKPQLDIPLHFKLEGRKGEVVRIDRFGNVITNIPPGDKEEYRIESDKIDRDISWFPNYEKGPDDDIFLVTGSAGTLEISLKNGRASDMLQMGIGQDVRLE